VVQAGPLQLPSRRPHEPLLTVHDLVRHTQLHNGGGLARSGRASAGGNWAYYRRRPSRVVYGASHRAQQLGEPVPRGHHTKYTKAQPQTTE
jgi:hypothetical protein